MIQTKRIEAIRNRRYDEETPTYITAREVQKKFGVMFASPCSACAKKDSCNIAFFVTDFPEDFPVPQGPYNEYTIWGNICIEFENLK